MKCLTIFTFAFLLLTGCKKEKKTTEPAVPKPQMPARTVNGKNIIAYKVNGKIHVYEHKSTYMSPFGVTFIDHGKWLFISAHNGTKYTGEAYNDYMFITISKQIQINTPCYFSNESGSAYAEYIIGNGFENQIFTTSNGSGNITYTKLDSVVAAGTFTFTAYNTDSMKVEITDGFFDISVK